MPVIGTAGHVDHGKSTLVHALTGRDPDRWREEKERGLTIDLGFAWTTLPDGTEVSFVDVPGHERFIKNMLAGVEAIDVALLVVAADEGWMPQSEEHAAVLDLLGVRRGVVALTKVDRADDELAELAALEVEERLEGLTLAGSPIIPVAAPLGLGVDRLVAALGEQVAALPPAPEGRPRLWVDRSFTVAGAGTVVTGTLLGGSLTVGDQVTVWPGAHTARIRGLHTHERPVERVGPGRRVAVNLTGVDRADIARGSMLGLVDQWEVTKRVLVAIRTARYVTDFSDRGAYHLHVGSGAQSVRVRVLDDAADPIPALVELTRPLPLRVGDRFILREVGRRAVVAGGRIVDPAPPRRSRDARRAFTSLMAVVDHPDAVAAALLDVRGLDRLDRLGRHSGGGRPPGETVVGATAVAPGERSEIQRVLLERVRRHHRDHPLRPGISVAELAGAVDLDPDLVAALAARTEGLVVDGGLVAAAGFAGTISDEDEARWEEARARLEAAGRTPPRLSELGLDTELVHALERRGSLVRVAPDLAYLPERLDELVSVIRAMPGPFTVSEFREAAEVSRKYAVPLLEWADRRGITVRMGYRRRVR